MNLPRHSTIAAYLSLFIALGGTSYAAVKIPRNSVGSAQLRPHSVHMSDLASDARPSSKSKLFRAAVSEVVLDPNTQAVVDSLAGAVKGEKGETGAQGPAGSTGPQGAQGPQGATGIQGPAGVDGKDGRDGSPPIAGHVAEDGTVLWSSTGTLRAARRTGGVYCLRTTTGGLSSASVTLEDVGAFYTDQAFVRAATANCAGYDIEITIVRITGPDVATTAHPFYVVLD